MIMADTQNRLARELDSREKAARISQWQAPELLPTPNHRAGWKHRWVRVSIYGQQDAKNISSSLREGYEFCKAEDYPELMMHAITEGRFTGNIEIGGLMLARIPAEFMKQRNEYYDNMNRSQTESVDNVFLRQSDPRMPLHIERRSKTTFGSGS
jgi:hypothetical protein